MALIRPLGQHLEQPWGDGEGRHREKFGGKSLEKANGGRGSHVQASADGFPACPPDWGL